MNNRVGKAFRSLAQAVSVNVARLFISVVLTLLLPRFLGVEQYSYWQLYLFYLTYVVYSSLGWGEGLYLRYGGQEVDALDRGEVAGQFWAQVVYEVGLSILAWVALFLLVQDDVKGLILRLALVSAALDILRFSLQSVLQATNRIGEYARIAAAERVLFFVFAVAVLALGRRDFVSLVAAEIAARVLSLALALFLCRRVVFTRPWRPRPTLRLARGVIASGMTLMLAGAASQLVLGIVRFAIEGHWGTITFGKVSLTLSMANMLITCISAVGVVLFPMLRRMEAERVSALYDELRTVLTVLALGFLVLYQPMEWVLRLWLPQYADSLHYLVVLFPVILYESRTFVLTDTYFKTLGATARILQINLITVVLSAGLTAVTVAVFDSLDLAVLSIPLLVFAKNTLAETLLLRRMGQRPVWGRMAAEFLLVALFVAGHWWLGGVGPTVVYLVALAGYLLAMRRQISATATALRRMFRGQQKSTLSNL